jgi:hypothetical protein
MEHRSKKQKITFKEETILKRALRALMKTMTAPVTQDQKGRVENK